MRLASASLAVLVLGAVTLGGCSGDGCGSSTTGAAGTGEAAASSSAAPQASAALAPRPHLAPTVRQGGALARGLGEDALYVADEDHRALRRVPLPLGDGAAVVTAAMPGAPAQVLALDGRVLVTLREPGALLVLDVGEGGALAEAGRVELPSDAWGLAISDDERTVVVSSAWSHTVSVIDLPTLRVTASIDVAREPRGVVVERGGGRAWITHLVGAELTRIDDLRGAPKATRVLLPPAPLRSPSGVTLSASLGYAALLSPDGARLFVARHALGALGDEAWFGASTVDVLLTATSEALAPRRHDKLPFLRADRALDGQELVVPGPPLSPFTQPRAMRFRASTRTLLVASEGDDAIVELDALGLDPTRTVLARYPVGAERDPVLPVAGRCGAPTGLALSSDEQSAYVWCRSTYDLATVPLARFDANGAPSPDAAPAAPTYLRLAEDPLEDADASIGRRLFYDATDRVTSGGLACAGCHPEGRDDGHVWHEAKLNTRDGTQLNFLGHEANIPAEEGVKGVARRTPMLAGRVDAEGPYGWHGESPDLPSRLDAGFTLHRWGGMPKHEPGNLRARSARLAVFLRRGLVPPAVPARELDATEARGRALFESAEVGCARCHVPATGYTDRASYPIPRVPPRPGFDAEENEAFKTPSLRYVGGRAPYFHDGRAASLERLVDDNDDRMGRTKHLSAADRAALIAFLRTL